MITKKKLIVSVILSIVITGVAIGLIVWLATGGYSAFMPPVVATLPQDENAYTEDEKSALATSQTFWTAIENADGDTMRANADENCVFVHIGATFNLNDEITAYTSGAFRPTSVVFNGKNVNVYGDTAVVITDCNYSLLLSGMPTTHHFAVTEVYSRQNGVWKVVQFSFTALIS